MLVVHFFAFHEIQYYLNFSCFLWISVFKKAVVLVAYDQKVRKKVIFRAFMFSVVFVERILKL